MWKLARRFFALNQRHRALVLRAAAWLLSAHVLVGVLPFATVMNLLRRMPARRRADTTVMPDEYAIAVRRAAGVIPARCLVQAVAAAALLRRHKHQATLTIHVARPDAGMFEAHALVYSGTTIVTGQGRGMDWPVLFRLDLAA